MPTQEQLYQALRNADAAGDTEAARRIAQHIQATRSATPAATPATPEKKSGGFDQFMLDVTSGRKARDILAGGVRGAGSFGATLLTPLDALARSAGIKNDFIGRDDRRESMDDGLRNLGADTDSFAYGGGKLAAEIAGTGGVGSLAAKGAARALPALAASPTGVSLLNSVASAGMRTGAPAAATGGARLADLALRTAGGGINGALAAGLVNPDDVGFGAGIGAILPGGVQVAGAAGRKIGSVLGGAKPSPELIEQIAAARREGYVIPPTQAKPTLLNRALEGFSGKLTTAQNASAKNQQITNELAKRAIGANELSEVGLAEVRKRANAAYDELGKVGAFAVDTDFLKALDNAGSASAAMRKNFPELVNGQVDELINSMKSRGTFDAQPTIEAIKQFRANASALKKSTDPAQVALGRAQNKISSALEDLIDRNLQQSGDQGLLEMYREARKTLAKTYSVEKALNVSSGNVNAKKLADELKKGKPMTEELRQIADFAQTFPKAVQMPEAMGSLPGISPLDFAALGSVAGATANPGVMAGLIARPAARSLALSPMVQNNLMPGNQSEFIEKLLQNQRLQQLLYRSAPVAGQD